METGAFLPAPRRQSLQYIPYDLHGTFARLPDKWRLTEAILGSIVEEVLRNAGRDVLVVPAATSFAA